MQTDERQGATVTGVVTETLPNAMFRVEVSGAETPRLVLAYLAGKMRMYKIRVLVGDTVEMVLDQYGERARIVRRL